MISAVLESCKTTRRDTGLQGHDQEGCQIIRDSCPGFYCGTCSKPCTRSNKILSAHEGSFHCRVLAVCVRMDIISTVQPSRLVRPVAQETSETIQKMYQDLWTVPTWMAWSKAATICS